MSEPNAPAAGPLPSNAAAESIREFEDRSAQWLFEDPENVRGLLQIRDPELAERLDFTRAERVNRTFVPANLRKKESDLIFRVPYRGDAAEGGQEQAGQWSHVAMFFVNLITYRREEQELMDLMAAQVRHSKFRERAEVMNVQWQRASRRARSEDCVRL
jgi:hypothetical protein